MMCFSAVLVPGVLMFVIFFGIIWNSIGVLYNYRVIIPISMSEPIVAGEDIYDVSRKIAVSALAQFALSKCGYESEKISSGMLTDNANYDVIRQIQGKKSVRLTEVHITLPRRLYSVLNDKDYTGEFACIFGALKKENRLIRVFNSALLETGDSFSPEFAGIVSALVGSIFSVIVSVFAAVPIGILSAICLYELSKNDPILLSLVEAAVNNLAAVPSIVFGLIGFTFYVGVFNLPRGSSLVAGLTLAVMMLPNIVSATKFAIQNVPQYVRDGALALGASRMQSFVHHVFPLALPGILHGMLLSIARVVGESSPLLMLGLVAFIVDIPKSIMDKATVLPVQVYMWSTSADFNFIGLASVTLLLLLLFLLILNLLSAFVRRNMDHFSF